MKITGIVFTLALCAASHGQLRFSAKAMLDSIKVREGAPTASGEKTTDVYFRFKGVPSKFYHSLSGNRLTIDFYDSGRPVKPFYPEILPPFKHIAFSEERIEGEKAEGLDKDLREVIRVAVEFDKQLSWDYTVTGQSELITLSSVWKKSGKVVSVEDRPKSRLWMYVLVGAVVVGGATVIYAVANSKPDDGNSGLYK